MLLTTFIIRRIATFLGYLSSRGGDQIPLNESIQPVVEVTALAKVATGITYTATMAVGNNYFCTVPDGEFWTIYFYDYLVGAVATITNFIWKSPDGTVYNRFTAFASTLTKEIAESQPLRLGPGWGIGVTSDGIQGGATLGLLYDREIY